MKSEPFLCPLVAATDVSLVGGKAVNLARLIAAGLAVPDGFVITTAAFRTANGSCSIPREVAAQIQAAYEQMGSPMVAARSSATAEDLAEASMAGQYDTFLNLSGTNAVLDGVTRCWQSLKSERLQAYLMQQGITPESVDMAVVVQRLVPADVAGVLFTADPRTGNSEEMLIEAAWGLGEGVVSGMVEPDRVRLRASDGSVIHYHVADKSTRLSPGKEQFEDVAESDRSRACLRAQSLSRLWELGRLAAGYFGGPQDIEWAMVDGQVHILQSRPITTLREAALRHGLPGAIRRDLTEQLASGRGPWVLHNLDETLPHPTPLTWSILKPFMSGSGGFGRMYEHVGFHPSEALRAQGFLELIGGRIYMDCARMPEMFSKDYPFKFDVALLRTNPDAAQQPPSIPHGSIAQQRKAARLAQRVTANLRREAVDLDKRFDAEFVPAVELWCRDEHQRDLTQLTGAELASLWESRCVRVLDDFGLMAFLPSMIEALAVSDLREFLDEHVWDEEPETLLQSLVVGPTPDQTFQANAGLQEVGCGKRSRASWLAEFGDRGPAEFDLASPRWNDRPDDLDTMATRLASEPPLLELHTRRQADARASLEGLRQVLTRELFEELCRRVELASRYVRFREDGKHYLMQAYVLLRQTALEFGRRLEIDADVFLLENAEMTEALSSGFVPQDRIVQRRFLRSAEDSLSLPRVIDAQDLPALGMPVIDADASCWMAHVLSPGTCSGAVRIVHSPETAGDLGKNYVLICPSTDPSWTPLFVGAAGLILERGGALSHGAIVARELGLPAVVLDRSTHLFKDGEIVTLDAYGGQVIRGASKGPPTEEPLNNHPHIERCLQPPIVGRRERAAAQSGLLAALLWGGLALAMWLLPAEWLHDPLFAGLDWILWPLVPRLGMPGTVAVIAAFFAVLPLLIQKFFVDNERVVTARDRAAQLRKIARGLPQNSLRRQAMQKLAAPVTMRVLRAALTSLAFVLGPMILVFLWLPARLDPASWNAAPGQTVTVLAEVQGDWVHPLRLHIPQPLQLDSVPAEQTLPPIRSTLEELRTEWAQRSDVTEYPWELQAVADHVHEAMLASLDNFLAGEIPTQKLSWRVAVPQQAAGHYRLQLETEDHAPMELSLAFGNLAPPVQEVVTSEQSPIYSLKAVYPPALHKNVFWTPLQKPFGLNWDFGWLGVYLIAYLPTMILFKKLLRVA